MKVTLRKRKISKGRLSLYLDIYKGTNSNGKLNRDTESLGMYIHSSPKDKKERDYNKSQLGLAEKIAVQRQNEYNNNKYGFQSKEQLNANFLEYFLYLAEKRKESKGNYGNWDSVYKHLVKYTGNKVVFRDLDVDFVEGFKEYLQKNAIKKNGDSLSTNSQVSYFRKLKAALKKAYQDRIINFNPADRVKGISEEETFREYLTVEEIEVLAKTPLKPEVLKRAFLFSTLTGLRFGDIKKLDWSDIIVDGKEMKIKLRQQKTNKIQYLDLNPQAVKLMGERKELSTNVFHGLKYDNNRVKLWVANSGIKKKITFHNGRHTHATLLMTSGADLYVIKEILGHKNIHTTQIYTKIVDTKRKEAIRNLPKINL